LDGLEEGPSDGPVTIAGLLKPAEDPLMRTYVRPSASGLRWRQGRGLGTLGLTTLT